MGAGGERRHEIIGLPPPPSCLATHTLHHAAHTSTHIASPDCASSCVQTPSLTYFDIRGLAEAIRLTLAATGAEFVDDRIPFTYLDGKVQGEWIERKAAAPYGQVPYLTVDGVKIAQSGAIIRYIASRYNFQGSNPIENALIDAGYEAVVDIRKAYFAAKSDAVKAEAFWSKSFPDSVAFLAKNVTGAPFFSAKLSYVDVAIYYLIWVFNTENKEAVAKALADNPKIQAIYDAVEKDEKVAAYLAARKVTPM